MRVTSKPLVWLRGDVKTPPFSAKARVEAGYLLRLLQEGERLGLPESRPMSTIGPNCHELRVVDENKSWRILYGLRVTRS
jgi:phage-related protein